jgi:hypothetical protein
MTNNKNHLVVTPALSHPPFSDKVNGYKGHHSNNRSTKNNSDRNSNKKNTNIIDTHTHALKIWDKPTFFPNVRINNSAFRFGAFYQN